MDDKKEDHSTEELAEIRERTLGHYNANAQSFWEGTKDHDVAQNIDALLRHLTVVPPARILDLGCGPGRDLLALKKLGHDPVGLDGAHEFVAMARQNSGCEVLHQDFLALDLSEHNFDGIFANAVLFHVPGQELPRVLANLWRTLVPGGVLFCSNPRGDNREGWSGARYGAYWDLETYRVFLKSAGFEEIEHYYRPKGLPREKQPWLATVWRKPKLPV